MIPLFLQGLLFRRPGLEDLRKDREDEENHNLQEANPTSTALGLLELAQLLMEQMVTRARHRAAGAGELEVELGVVDVRGVTNYGPKPSVEPVSSHNTPFLGWFHGLSPLINCT